MGTRIGKIVDISKYTESTLVVCLSVNYENYGVLLEVAV